MIPSTQSTIPVDSGLLVLNEVAGHRNFTPAPTQVPSPSTFVRKCAGKNKQAECLQNCNHPNTRWECAFESQNKEEFLKHCKNITKRNKWKELVEQTKQDKEGMYRCPYFSTDRHHVENHFQKGSGSPDVANTPIQALRYKSMLHQQRSQSNPTGFSSNILGNGTNTPLGKYGHPRVVENSEERDMKRMRQDATLLQTIFQENSNNAPEQPLPDSMKTEELLDQIEKRLEVPHDMCKQTLEKLHKNGFMIIAPLRALKKDAWERLELPIAIEEELKNYIGFSKQPQQNYMQYSPQQVTGGWGFTPNATPGGYGYNQMGSYYPYGGYEGADNSGASESGDSEKDKLGVVVGEGSNKDHHDDHHHHVVHHHDTGEVMTDKDGEVVGSGHHHHVHHVHHVHHHPSLEEEEEISGEHHHHHHQADNGGEESNVDSQGNPLIVTSPISSQDHHHDDHHDHHHHHHQDTNSTNSALHHHDDLLPLKTEGESEQATVVLEEGANGFQ